MRATRWPVVVATATALLPWRAPETLDTTTPDEQSPRRTAFYPRAQPSAQRAHRPRRGESDTAGLLQHSSLAALDPDLQQQRTTQDKTQPPCVRPPSSLSAAVACPSESNPPSSCLHPFRI